MMRTAFGGILGLGACLLGCAGPMFARPKDVPTEAMGGGGVTVRMTGKLAWSGEVPGATAEQLATLQITSGSADGVAYVLTQSGRQYLSAAPAVADAVWHGPEHGVDWMVLTLDAEGELVASFGIYDSYPGDAAGRMEGKGPPVDLSKPGSASFDVVFTKGGDAEVGVGHVDVTWDFDPTVTRSWLQHYEPRRAM